MLKNKKIICNLIITPPKNNEEQYSSAKRTPKNQKTGGEDEVFIEALPRRAV